MKTIIKETCIILLLCIAIILVLGIVFYDYIPITKVIPEKVSYIAPENVKGELETEEKTEEITTQTTVYEITTSDLKNYENMGIYNKGKQNPFEMPSQSNTNQVNTTNNETTENDNNSSNQNQGYLFNTVGK